MYKAFNYETKTKKKKKSLIACDETSRMYKRVTMEPRNAMLELRID